MTKSDLMRKMHCAGLRLDDAALAAQVAVNAMTEERDSIICRIRMVLSVREIAPLLGLGKTTVARICTDADEIAGRRELRAHRLRVIKAEREKGRGYAKRAAHALGMSVDELWKLVEKSGIAKRNSPFSHDPDGDGTAQTPNLHATADG